MIIVYFAKDKLTLTNHAGNTKLAKLVCCGASAIVQCAISWFKKTDIKLTKNDKIPLLSIELINRSINNQNLLNLIFKQLLALKKQYSRYITIKKGKR